MMNYSVLNNEHNLKTIRLINDIRRENGLDELIISEELMKWAKKHVEQIEANRLGVA